MTYRCCTPLAGLVFNCLAMRKTKPVKMKPARMKKMLRKRRTWEPNILYDQ
uniref:Uncharacterized protein n=1 Tax=Rhizophora mucronata TaxID=61149 RepID=A0A2P2K2A4_RHIMU